MKGKVVYLYAFDVADEITFSSIREVLGEKTFPFQMELGATVPRDIPIERPLAARLPEETLDSSVGRVSFRPLLKIFDVGALSISYEIPFEVTALSDLVPYHSLTAGGVSLTVRAERLCSLVAENLRPHMTKPALERPPAEAYTVFCVADLPAPVPDWAQTHRAEVAALLNEEIQPGRLAAAQVEETFRQVLAYTQDDFAVIDWDAAFAADRSGTFDDVLYMVELANLQLEEFRLLDDRLDRLFLQAHNDLELYSRTLPLLFAVRRRLRSLRSIRMDITKMSEEVSNITKFVGDWYLARVYLACKDRFHLRYWEASVDQKLQELDRLYSLFQADVNADWMLALEATIVALFLLDLAALVFMR